MDKGDLLAIIFLAAFAVAAILGVRDCLGAVVEEEDLLNRATKTCHPYQISKSYKENGHELVVCKTEKGLV